MLWPNKSLTELDTLSNSPSTILNPSKLVSQKQHFANEPINQELTQRELLAQQKGHRALSDSITDGNLEPKLISIRKHIEKDISPELRKLLYVQYIETVLQLAGDEPAVHIRSLAKNNKDNCSVINELVWEFVTRTEKGETLRPKIVEALVDAINLALQADPMSTTALDTKAHLCELAGDLDTAIETAKRAVDLSQESSPDKLPKPAYVQYLKKLQVSISTETD